MNHMLVINVNDSQYLTFVSEEETIKEVFSALFGDEATQFVIRGNSIMCWFENEPPKTGMIYSANEGIVYEI